VTKLAKVTKGGSTRREAAGDVGPGRRAKQ
jgi:hypothetical protein